MTQPPSVFLKRREGTPDLVLRTGTDPTAPGKGQPVAGAEADYKCGAEEQAAGQPETDSHQEQSEEDGCHARQR
jgi:hypothetical protein